MSCWSDLFNGTLRVEEKDSSSFTAVAYCRFPFLLALVSINASSYYHLGAIINSIIAAWGNDSLEHVALILSFIISSLGLGKRKINGKVKGEGETEGFTNESKPIFMYVNKTAIWNHCTNKQASSQKQFFVILLCEIEKTNAAIPNFHFN